MRRQFLLEEIVKHYRLVSIVGSILIAVIAALTVWALARAEWTAGPPVPLFAAVGGSFAGLVVLLRWGYVQLARSLTAAAVEQNRILDSAHRDALTGAFTRSYFLLRLREHLQDLDRPVAYLQIDMDNLKIVNDSHGHAAGDAALVHLVRTLERLLPDALIGRLGGDEFGVAIIGHDNKPALRRLGDHILIELGRSMDFAGRPMPLSATIGLALWPEDAAEASDLLSKADLALYRGKRNGRAAAIVFERDLLADERYKRFVERDLRAAILLNELDLHYQPIFSADGRTIVSHEALVRWRHTVRGQILPPDFIPIAEQSDLIDKLGDWVLARACADLPQLGSGRVGVNVSTRQLRRADFVDSFAAILKTHGVSGDRIVIEVTETLPMKAGAVELANLAALRALGVRVAIDDFGAAMRASNISAASPSTSSRSTAPTSPTCRPARSMR